MRIIVTGGAGFIGSAVVWRLNELGIDDILIADVMDETEKWKNLVPLRFADYIDAYDLMDDLDEFKDADVVFHLGACSSTTETDADYMIRNNYHYTQDLARWAVKNDIRFIYASSAATYGDGSAGMEDGFENLGKLRPLNVYGYSKHLFDQWAARNGLFDKIVGLKFFNVFGPNENHKGDMRSLVNKAFDQINATGELQLFRSANPEYADGEFGRDFVYVKDAVEMTLHFMKPLATASGSDERALAELRATDTVRASDGGALTDVRATDTVQASDERALTDVRATDTVRGSDEGALTDVRASETRGGLFNVGSGRMNTWNALADAIFKALDLPRNVEFIDMPEHLRDRYQYHTQADLTRIRKSGYAAETTPLDSAVADYVRNYLVPGKHLGD